jgi:hypothetical protein
MALMNNTAILIAKAPLEEPWERPTRPRRSRRKRRMSPAAVARLVRKSGAAAATIKPDGSVRLDFGTAEEGYSSPTSSPNEWDAI